ncbi:YhdP family protein [Aliikangiella sp. IMCC44653]
MSKLNSHWFSKTLAYIINKLWLFIAASIILIALIFTLLRVSLPQINYFKDDLIQWVETHYQVDLSIDLLTAEWKSHGPIIYVNNISLSAKDTTEELFSASQIEFSIDGLNTLINQQVVTEKIKVHGANLRFLVDRNLGFKIEPYQQQNNIDISQISHQVFNILFNQKDIAIVNSQIEFVTLAGKSFEYQVTQLNVNNFPQVHQIQGELANQKTGSIKLVAEMHGEPSSDSSYTNVYLKGNQIQLKQLPIFESYPQLKPEHGELDWQVWAVWQQGRWDSASGEVELTDIDWEATVLNLSNGIENNSSNQQSAQPKAQAINQNKIELFKANFNWAFKTQNTGELIFHDLGLKLTEQQAVTLPIIGISYLRNSRQQPEWRVATHDWQFSNLAQWWQLFDTKGLVDDSSLLALNINDLAATFKKETNGWAAPEMILKFNGLVSDAIKGIPSISQLEGSLLVADKQSHIKLSSSDAEFFYPAMFREKLTIGELSAALTVEKNSADDLQVAINNFDFKNTDLELNTRGRFFTENGELQVALASQLNNVDVAQKSKYLPVGVMTDSLTGYLDESVQAGKLSWVSSLLHGPIQRFPFQDNSGTFNIHAWLNQANYQFLPQWPVVKNLDAYLIFEGNGMHLTALSGSSEKVKINSAEAIIKDFSAEHTPMELFFDANSINNSGQAYLHGSTLNDLAETLDNIDFFGEIKTKAKMHINLGESKITSLDGVIEPLTKDNYIIAGGFKVTELAGKILIDKDGIKPSKLKANYFSAPLTIAVESPKGEGSPELSVKIDGLLNQLALTDVLGNAWSQFLSGETAFNTELIFSPVDKPGVLLVNVDSDLVGLTVDFPAQFAKQVKQKTPFSMQMQFAPDNSANAKINWQGIQSRWWWQNLDGKVEHSGGAILYNSEYRVPDINPGKFVADLSFKQLKLDDWLSFVKRVESSFTPEQDKKLPELALTLRFEDIQNPYFLLNNISLDGSVSAKNGWDLKLKLDQGELDFSGLNQHWNILANDLQLKFTPGFAQSFYSKSEITDADEQMQKPVQANDSAAGKPIDYSLNRLVEFYQPLEQAQVDIACINCELDKIRIGDFKARLKQNQLGYFVKGNLLDNSRHNLNFHGYWLNYFSSQDDTNQLMSFAQCANEGSACRAINQTSLEYQLSSDDVGKLMKNWQYPVGISDSGGVFSGRLNWSDTPFNFNLQSLRGDAHFELSQGYLNDVSDAKARLFSLFSLQSLSRRLKLDFKDVYKDGFFYEKITGDIQLNQGELVSDNIYIDGSAAKVAVGGSLNLVDQSIEQRALVTPQLTSSLPVLIGWAVEPTTGILIFLLNKMFEPAIEVVSQIEYRIHGDLAQPQVEEIKAQHSTVKYQVTPSDIEKAKQQLDLEPVDSSEKE